MQERGEVNSPALVSGKQLSTLERQETFESLPLTLSEHLFGLMIKVTKEEVTPQTVNAACNCASEINKLLALSLKS